MKIIYDERDWGIMPVLNRGQCPFLRFPANIYQCNYPKFGIGNIDKSLPECNMEICPIRVKNNDHAKAQMRSDMKKLVNIAMNYIDT